MGPHTQLLKHFIGMKNYRFNLYSFVAVMSVACVLIGCEPLNQNEIAGSYVRTQLGITDSISIESNGTFTQNVVLTNGRIWSASGTWVIINRVVQLDKCYLTFDSEKQATIIPPQVVYSCTFSFEGRKLIRSELQPPWIKAITK